MKLTHRIAGSIEGNVWVTDDAAWAVWSIPLRGYTRVLSSGAKIQQRRAVADAIAALPECEFHLIVAPMPFGTEDWRRGMHGQLRPTSAPGAATYIDATAQALDEWSLHRDRTWLLIKLDDRVSGVKGRSRRLLGLPAPPLTADELGGYQRKEESLHRFMEHPGLNGRRATPGEIAALLQRCYRRGAPRGRIVERAQRYGRGEVASLGHAEFVEHSRHLEQTWPHRQYVKWIRVGDMPPELPGIGGEWLAFEPKHQGRPFPWERHVHGRIISAGAAIEAAEHGSRQAEDQIRNAREAKTKVSDEMRAAAMSMATAKDYTAAVQRPELREVYILVGVWGDSVAEVEDRAAVIMGRYSDMNVATYDAADDQALFHAEATPGGRVARPLGIRDSNDQAMPIETFAGAGWWTTKAVGSTNVAHYLGRTPQDDPVFGELWEPIEENRPAGATVTGESGHAGKSNLLGQLAIQGAYVGAAELIIDPSGQLGRLQALGSQPGDRPRGIGTVQVRTLGPADVGVLDPTQLVAPEMVPALAAAVLQVLLPRRDALEFEVAIREACQTLVGADSLKEVIAPLRANAEVPNRVADGLRITARSPFGRLCFREMGRSVAPLRPEPGITVLQVQDMRDWLPDPKLPREQWDAADREVLTVNYLLAQYARRFVNAPELADVSKLVALDEVQTLSVTAQGERLLPELCADGRKRDTVILMATQLETSLPASIQGNLGQRWSGRQRYRSEAEALLRNHGQEVTDENIAYVQGLPPHTFLYSNGLRTGPYTADLVFRQIREVLDTTPGAGRRRRAVQV